MKKTLFAIVATLLMAAMLTACTTKTTNNSATKADGTYNGPVVNADSLAAGKIDTAIFAATKTTGPVDLLDGYGYMIAPGLEDSELYGLSWDYLPVSLDKTTVLSKCVAMFGEYKEDSIQDEAGGTTAKGYTWISENATCRLTVSLTDTNPSDETVWAFTIQYEKLADK